ncbi:MAG TPA: FUSC family membrane protein [Chiayiivirga sp.]|nr:FUSC family membrane protein [Chiayiivirga sp.]
MTSATRIHTHLRRTGREIRRSLLSAHVLNGAVVAIGLLLVAMLVFALGGQAAAVSASAGAIVVLLCDGVRSQRGKLGQLLAAPMLGLPLHLAVQLLRDQPLPLALLLVAATFVAFLFTAWGRRGMPVTAAVMFAMLLALAPMPAASWQEAVLRTAWCALGAGLYVLHGVACNALFNNRYRHQVLADVLLTTAALLRIYARRIQRELTHDAAVPSASTLSDVLRRQAALADELQVARDMILESPDTPVRQRLASMLVVVFEIRDRAIAAELDIERMHACHDEAIATFGQILCQMASDVEQVADALLRGRLPARAQDHRVALEALRDTVHHRLHATNPTLAHEQSALVRSVSVRMGDQDAAVRQLVALARGEIEPDLSAVRTGWHLFVSPAYWSWRPLLRVWHWRQPALRHALRAALAIAAGLMIARSLPWASRDYWILLTIVVVLRGSLAQTLERRDERVLGTLIGSVLAALLLALQPPMSILLMAVVLAQGVAHAFVARRYTVTAMAASVLGLVLAHLLAHGTSSNLAFIERIGDTMLGAAVAWGFSYILPMWEREQLAERVVRVCNALARHAQHSLALMAVNEVAGQPELTWRLARREAYDALSALVQTTGRALVEPRAVRPPLAQLEQLQAHGYQLLGQLSAIQSILVLRRERLQPALIAAPVNAASQHLQSMLDLGSECPGVEAEGNAEGMDDGILLAIPEVLPEAGTRDVGPWLLRRLGLALHLAQALRADADGVIAILSKPTPGHDP